MAESTPHTLQDATPGALRPTAAAAAALPKSQAMEAVQDITFGSVRPSPSPTSPGALAPFFR